MFHLCFEVRYRLTGKNKTDILRSKAMVNCAFSSIPKGRKNGPFAYPAFNMPILIRSDSLKQKIVCQICSVGSRILDLCIFTLINQTDCPFVVRTSETGL